MLREQPPHLFLRLHVFQMRIADSFGIAHALTMLDGPHHVVRDAVFTVYEMNVVGGDNLDAQLLCNLEDAGISLFLQAVQLVNALHIRLPVIGFAELDRAEIAV